MDISSPCLTRNSKTTPAILDTTLFIPASIPPFYLSLACSRWYFLSLSPPLRFCGPLLLCSDVTTFSPDFNGFTVCLPSGRWLINLSPSFRQKIEPPIVHLPLVINDFIRYTHLEIENVVHTREDLASLIALQLGRRCLCIGKREQQCNATEEDGQRHATVSTRAESAPGGRGLAPPRPEQKQERGLPLYPSAAVCGTRHTWSLIWVIGEESPICSGISTPRTLSPQRPLPPYSPPPSTLRFPPTV